MRKIKGIIFIFSLLMFMPNIIKAQCDYSEKSRLQALASNINFSYNYEETGNGIDSSVSFNIIVSNVRPELYIVDQTNVRVYNYDGNNDLVINGYKPGNTIRFIAYGNVGDCAGVELINNYVTLPSYNRFYKDPICNDVKDYKLCNRWTRVDLTYDNFIKKVEEYKSQINTDTVPVVEQEISFFEKIIIFLSKYSFYIFGGIIIVCVALIFYLERRDDFGLN